MSETKLQTVEFSALLGEHVLTGVSRETLKLPSYEGSERLEDSAALNFELDGVVYSAVEDPEDGYRSSMRHFVVGSAEVARFAPHRVTGSMRADDTEYGHQSNDVLELRDVVTGKVVLAVGTDNYDDYYPSFVADWNPENLAANAGVASGSGGGS
jgi:hypothetical protein